MKIVVIGGTGLIGSKVVARLTEHGHEAVPASPRLGINTITGEGLAAALDGASVVVDVSNSPNFEYATALDFFATSTQHLLIAEAAAGVGPPRRAVGRRNQGAVRGRRPHEDDRRVLPGEARRGGADPDVRHPVLDRPRHPVLRVHQEHRRHRHRRETVRLPPVAFQPMAAADVAKAVARTAVGAPVNGIVEVGGPETFPFDEAIRRALAAMNDPRTVVADPSATYYGIAVGERSLVPDDGAMVGEIRLDDWLREATADPAGHRRSRPGRSRPTQPPYQQEGVSTMTTSVRPDAPEDLRPARALRP